MHMPMHGVRSRHGFETNIIKQDTYVSVHTHMNACVQELVINLFCYSYSAATHYIIHIVHGFFLYNFLTVFDLPFDQQHQEISYGQSDEIHASYIILIQYYPYNSSLYNNIPIQALIKTKSSTPV